MNLKLSINHLPAEPEAGIPDRLQAVLLGDDQLLGSWLIVLPSPPQDIEVSFPAPLALPESPPDEDDFPALHLPY